MPFRRPATAILLAALAGCAAPAPEPAPPPVVRPVPRPAPPPAAATGSDWRDWPLTPGDWSYRQGPAGSTASYGSAISLACDPASRSLMLVRQDAGLPAGPPPLTVRTSSVTRVLTAASTATGKAFVTFAANDPLLDAMGFSRGRFVIEQAGQPTLVLPAWPEILRVAEDCRG